MTRSNHPKTAHLFLIAGLLTISSCVTRPSQENIVTAKPFTASTVREFMNPPVSAINLEAGEGVNWALQVDQAKGRIGIFGFGLILSKLEISDDASFSLSIRSSNTDSITYSAQELREKLQYPNRFETDVIYDDDATIEIRDLTIEDGVSFIVSSLTILPGAPSETEREELRSNIDGLFQSYALVTDPEPALVDASRAIASLHIKKTSRETKYCTGFLIAHDLVMTNYHCVTDSNKFVRTKNRLGQGKVLCDDITLHFDYFRASDLYPTSKKTVSAKCEQILAWSQYRVSSLTERPLLDFAIMQVDPLRIHAAGRRKPLKIAEGRLGNNQKQFILGHPQNWPLTLSGPCVAKKSRDARNMGQNWYQYGCSTFPGNSGSPLLNSEYSVVGLHYGTNDKRESAFIDFEPGKPLYNAAVPIEEIFKQAKIPRILEERSIPQ